MSDFYSNLKQTQDNVSITENGAVGYKSSGKVLTDFFFKVSSFRNVEDVSKEVKELLSSNDPYVLKLLFYIRDIKEGLGERRLFKEVIKVLLKTDFENKDTFFLNTISLK